MKKKPIQIDPKTFIEEQEKKGNVRDHSGMTKEQEKQFVENFKTLGSLFNNKKRK